MVLTTRSLLLITVLFAHYANTAFASALFFNPQNVITVAQDEIATVELYLDTETKKVNAIDATMTFDPAFIEVVDVSRGNSVIPLWISDPVVNNDAGTVQFTGGIPGGSTFASGLMASVTVRGVKTGDTALAWDARSTVLLNDGLGTPDAVEFLPTPVTIEPPLKDVPLITSLSHPDQSAWYRDPIFMPAWTLNKDALYSYTLDHDPKTIPDETPDTPKGELVFAGTLKYENLPEGVYYFHLREGVKEGTHTKWSRARTFRAHIDLTPPTDVRAEIGNDASLFEGRPFLSFAAADALSGIARFDVKEPSVEWVDDVSLPYELHSAASGGALALRAVDKAGNMTEISVPYPKVSRVRWEVWGLALLAALAALVFAVVRIKKRR